ncbi:MAG: tetratricopeptide repeat protein [Alphaproteobacteria bacterium]|nr:tetratricopeptide repeat protein [Alphaproteobacteria bacterium]
MKRTLFALLSAAALLSLPTLGVAQQGGQAQGGQPKPAPAAKPAPPRVPQFALVPLSGRYLAARVAEQDHDYEGGADEIDRALALSPDDPDLVYSAFRMRLYAGRIDQAAELAPQVLARKPGDAMANLVLAVQSIKKGDYRTAEFQLGKIGADNSLGPLRESMLVWLKAGEKDYAAARALLAKLKTAGVQRGEGVGLIDEAQLDEMAGDKAGAEAKYRRAMGLDKNNLRSMILIAEGLRRLGKTDEANELLKSVGEKFTDTVVMDGMLGPNAPTPKPPTAASGISDLLYEIGSSLVADPRNQRADLALIFYELSLNLRPDNDFAWLLLSSLYEQFDMTGKAIAALGKIAPSSPLHWQARLRIAALDAKEDHFDQAVSRLQAMVAEKPERTDAALTLAELLRTKERYAEAAQAYDTTIQRIKGSDERYWPVYFGRGIVLERLKQWPKAEQDMKKALELSPDQPHVLNYLGYSWIDQGLHLNDGMKMLERATELRPDDGAITDSVGWAFYRLGQYDKAVEWLEKAIEQKSDDATITEHLGDAYWHVGRFREARFQWERALNQKPDKDRLPVIKDKLANGLSAANDKPTVYERAADGKQGG